MQVGDLVTWKPDLPMHFSNDFGVIIEIVDDYLVGVLWFGSTEVYLEPIKHLETVNESW